VSLLTVKNKKNLKKSKIGATQHKFFRMPPTIGVWKFKLRSVVKM